MRIKEVAAESEDPINMTPRASDSIPNTRYVALRALVTIFSLLR